MALEPKKDAARASRNGGAQAAGTGRFTNRLANHAGGERGDARMGGRGGVAPLDSALKSFLRTSGIGEHLGPWTIFRAFAEAAGPGFARHARAVKLVRGELQGFLGEEIRMRANEILSTSDSKSAADIRRIAFRLRR